MWLHFGHGLPCPYNARHPTDLSGHSILCPPANAILELENASREIRLGDKVELLVPHCDPNVNLYDRFYCTRGENVEQVWRIEAQGHA